MCNPTPWDDYTPTEYPAEAFDRELSDLIDHAEHNAQGDPERARWWRLLTYQLTGLIPPERVS